MKTINILAILVATCMLIGCGTGRGGAVEPGKSRVLGEVSYDDAFAAAKGIMSQEYEIASADSVTGVIRGEPKSVQAKSERLLGGPSQSRELATMRILQHRTYVVAELTIAIQKQGQDIQTIQAGSNSYSGVPDQTPAQIDASTTPQQNSDWNTVRYATDKETLMLDQLYRAMQGRVTTQPATESARTVYPTLEEAAIAAWEFKDPDMSGENRDPCGAGKGMFDRSATLKLMKSKAYEVYKEQADLNGDGIDEVLMANGRFVDNAGKETNFDGAQNRTWAVLQKVTGGWRVVGAGFGCPCPPAVKEESSNGWRNIQSGHHLSAWQGIEYLYQFDGTRYNLTKQTEYDTSVDTTQPPK